MKNAADYESYLTPEQLEGYLKGKRLSQRLGPTARSVVADQLHGDLVKNGGKHFLETRLGHYRLALRPNSDNSTERRVHGELGVRTVVMNDPESLGDLFREHGLPEADALAEFYSRVRREMDETEPEELF